MRWLLALLLFCSTAAAETVTTDNVVPGMSAFTTSGSTTSSTTTGCTAGEFCTGNATAGGGTYTSSFDVPLTQAEVQRGFTLDSSVTVDSHPSNSVLATCTSITQSSDCRDIFNVTIALFDDTNTVVEKFEREIELDFGGLRTFSFEDTIAENSFSLLTGEFELFGIDAGFHGGFYGPKFSEPSLTFTYQNVVEQQILDQIAHHEVQVAVAAPPAPPPLEPMAPPPAPEAPPPPMQTNMAPPPPPEAPPPPTIQPVAAPQPEQRREEARAEAEIEAEMEAAPGPEPQERASEEPQRQEQPNEQPVAESSEQEQPETDSGPQAEAPAPKPKTRQEKVKAAAQKVVKKIAPSQRYNAASQTTTLVVMNILGARIATGPVLQDTQGFFPKESMTDNRRLSNPLQDYQVFGASNAAHEAFLGLEWSR